MAKILVFTKEKGVDKVPFGVMTKKPTAAQIKAGKIDLENDDSEIRFQMGRAKSEFGDQEYVCEGILTPLDDAELWHDVDGFQTFEVYFGEPHNEAEFI